MGMPLETLGAVGLAAFLGHLFPVFFEFQGGKGVATFLGSLLGIAWPLGIFFIVIWLLVAKLSKLSSLAALTAAALTPLFAWSRGYPALLLIAIAAMVVMLFWRHRSNIRRLLDGTEVRVGAKAANDSSHSAGPE
jgi:glycerol-3-phosphate acyltransferase PlsY